MTKPKQKDSAPGTALQVIPVFDPAPVFTPSAEKLLAADPTVGGKFCGKRKKLDKETGLPRHGDPKQLTCTRPSGWGTNHVGTGPCKLHGGVTSSPTGRYSKAMKPTHLVTLTEAFEADPDPLNILPELAVARALFTDFINRYDDFSEALVAWWASWEASHAPMTPERVQMFVAVVEGWEHQIAATGQPPTPVQQRDLTSARAFVDLIRRKSDPDGAAKRPRQVLDITSAYALVSEITKIVERIENIRAQNAISRADFIRLTAAMANIVQKYVTEPSTLDGIRREWLDLTF
jgi:hypothetical protein